MSCPASQAYLAVFEVEVQASAGIVHWVMLPRLNVQPQLLLG